MVKKRRFPLLWFTIGFALVASAIILLVVLNTGDADSDVHARANNSTCAIIIPTFIGYNRFWDPMVHFLKKHYAGDWPIYFITDFGRPNNTERLEIVETRGKEWGDRILLGLESVKEDYVLMLQEDIWLNGTLEQTKLDKSLVVASTNNLNELKLQDNCNHSFHSNIDVYDHRWYVFSHQPGIWKKSFLISTLSKTSTPFNHEIGINQKYRQQPNNALSACDQSWNFPYNGVSFKGSLTDIGKKMLQSEQLPFIIDPDQIMTRKNQ
jgi:hypothetical protein